MSTSRISKLAATLAAAVTFLATPGVSHAAGLPAPVLTRTSRNVCVLNGLGQFIAQASFSGRLLVVEYRDGRGLWNSVGSMSNPSRNAVLRVSANAVPTVGAGITQIRARERASTGEWSQAGTCSYHWGG
jgi:hypothetical protein